MANKTGLALCIAIIAATLAARTIVDIPAKVDAARFVPVDDSPLHAYLKDHTHGLGPDAALP